MHIAVITVFIGTSPTLTLAYSYFKGLTSISPLRTNPAWLVTLYFILSRLFLWRSKSQWSMLTSWTLGKQSPISMQ